MGTPSILNEEKVDMADLRGQQSVGCLVLSCPVVRTELQEGEAELSVASVIGGDAVQSKSVGDSDSQLPSQHLALINTSTRSEANSPRANIEAACQCNPVVIDGELTALEASNENDGTERVLVMDSREQITRVRTCRRIPVILDWKDGDVESRGVALTDPGEIETSDEVTSMHAVEMIWCWERE